MNKMNKVIETALFFLLCIQGIALVVGSTNSNFNHNYWFNSHISLDPNSNQVEGETESINFYHNTEAAGEEINIKKDKNGDGNNNNLGNHIDNVAMFFHGPSRSHHDVDPTQPHTQHSQSFIAMGECAFVFHDRNNHWDEDDYYFDDEDDEDEDEDDDNDGHSSMLSNASIRQRVSATRASYSQGHNNNKNVDVNANRQQQRKKSTTHMGALNMSNQKFHRNQPLKSPSSSSLTSLLKVRGGATAAAPVADEFAKRLFAAATVTVLYEGVMGHCLEFLKIAMQTAPVGSATYMTILRTITSQKGIFGLWDGFLPWGFVQAVCKGGIFGLAHAMAKTYLKPLVDQNILPEQAALTLAGGIAGGVQGFVLSPLLLLKTRVMTNPVFRENMTLLRTTLLSLTIGFEVVKNEGILALMKGADIFAIKRVFDWSTRYYFSDMFKSIMLHYGYGINGVLRPAEKIMASLLSGTASTLVTLPLDVIVAKSQDAKKAGVKVSAWETFIQDYKESGLKGLYDANMMGFEARLVHVCLTTVVMQFGSPLMFEYLFGNK